MAVVCLSVGFGAPAVADLAIVNARVYASPDAEPVEAATVLIRGERIVAVGPEVRIGPDAERLDVGGAAVLAGFWNSHVHLLTPPLLDAEERSAVELSAELEAMFTRFGFTTVFDIASSLENTSVIRERVRSGDVTGPRILTVGGPFFPANGTPIYVRELLESNGFPSWEVGTASAAAERARRQLEAGADGVKIFAGAIVGGDIGVLPMPIDIATAAVREGHRARKPAFAHPSSAAGLDVSLGSGVDVLAHTAPMMGPWSDELAARLVRQRVALIPTLFLFRIESRRADDPPEVEARMLETATQQLRAFAEAGGEVLFGTDAGYIDVYDTAEEFRQMSRVLDLRTILASLTTNPSDRFGDSRRRGRVATGFEADLVVLDGDPALDVTALARVRYTIRAGKILYRADATR